MDKNRKEKSGVALKLAIPTYRPMDIAGTVERYATNFEKYGHDVPIMVFDDSSRSKAELSTENLKDVSRKIGKHQEIYYVGPKEKSVFLDRLRAKFGESSGDLLDKIFRQGYGGNRNFVLAYTLGQYFVSVDDDMSPDALYSEDGRSTLSEMQMAKGKFVLESDARKTARTSQDVMRGYKKFLGTRVEKHVGNVIMGRDIEDPDVDNLGRTVGGLESRSMNVLPGETPGYDVKIKVVQTHLTGDADIDSADLVNVFMDTGLGEILSGYLPKKFVMDSCTESITSANSRFTGAVLGCDNTEGTIYFLPTSFRCEDFIWRAHMVNRDDVAVAYTEHIQTHDRALSVRASIANDWFNEMVAEKVKRRIRDSIDDVGPVSMSFHEPYAVPVTSAREIIGQLNLRKSQALKKGKSSNASSESYRRFAGDVDEILLGQVGTERQFSERLTDIVRNEIMLFNQTSELWPSILEEVSDMEGSLPQVDIRREVARG